MQICCCFFFFFLGGGGGGGVEALRPSQQFFSHVGTEPPLPGYYQYLLGGKCILLKDTTRIEPPISRSGDALPLGHRASQCKSEYCHNCKADNSL